MIFKKIQILAIKIYKAKKKPISPKLICDIFQFTDKMYDTRKKSSLRTKTDNTVYFGSKSISLLTRKIQKLVPESIKNKKSLPSSKRKIKFWTADKCN